MNKLPTTSVDLVAENNQANELSAMPYIKAAEDQYPTKEELLAEVNRQRITKQKKKTAITRITTGVFLIVGIWILNPSIQTETYTSKFAERMEIKLPDGSEVRLNTNSRVVAHLKLRSRELKLEQGEASFTVSHELRPFYVSVDQTLIRDIGTVFNVQKWNSYFVTTVQEGSIELENGEQRAAIGAGESIKVSNGNLGATYLADLDMVNAWQTGKIVFNGTLLKDAIANIQRYRKETINLDERVATLRLSGSYDIGSIEPLIDSFSTLFPVKVIRHPNKQIDITKNN